MIDHAEPLVLTEPRAPGRRSERADADFVRRCRAVLRANRGRVLDEQRVEEELRRGR
jgi:hypothetical protein